MIPQAIITAIETAVDAMSTGGGYNFDYGAVDVLPMVETGLPLVYLEFAEDTANDPDLVGKFSIESPLSFRVLVPESDTESVDAQAAAVELDLKNMMGALADPTLNALGMTDYSLVGSEKIYRASRTYPAQIKINITIGFRQVREGA